MKRISSNIYRVRIFVWLLFLALWTYSYLTSDQSMSWFYITIGVLFILVIGFQFFFVDLYIDAQFHISLFHFKRPLTYQKMVKINRILSGLRYDIVAISYLSYSGYKKIRFCYMEDAKRDTLAQIIKENT